MRALNRITPKGPAHLYKTYAVAAPLATHFRLASCEEINCPDYINGWQIRKEDLSPELLHTATNSSRRYQELPVAEGETYLIFLPGQPCFRAGMHMVPNGRPELYVVGRGDHRLFNPRDARVHSGPEDFVDDMKNHFDKIRTVQERG